MEGFHFYQRTHKQLPILEGKVKKGLEGVLDSVLKEAGVKGRVIVEDSHFHVFGSINPEKRLFFINRIKEELADTGVRWAAGYYMDKLRDTSKEYVDGLIKDLHKRNVYSEGDLGV
jgi:hypothetical protein